VIDDKLKNGISKDHKFTLYKCLAFSALKDGNRELGDGLMEFVEGSVTI